MSCKCKYYLTNISIMVGILALAFGVGVFLDRVLFVGESIAMLFVFGVFLISVFTEGYLFGIMSAFISVIAVNFAFTFPYFAFNFTIPENFMSALVMIVISLMTSALATRLKKWQTIKAQSEMEMMRANLLRAVSHDLRTPLTGIYGSSSLLLEGESPLSEEQKRKLVGGIREDAEWLIRMVENLLSVTRLDAAKVELSKTPTVLEELFDSVLLKFYKRFPSERVSVSLPDEVLVVSMDPLLIEQVLINLLENAVQHAQGKHTLSLCAYREGENAVFSVSDDGCGIDEDKILRILSGDPVSFGEATDMQKRHAGIGLSVCATIVKAHGGSMTAKNLEMGGASFSFVLKAEESENDGE